MTKADRSRLQYVFRSLSKFLFAISGISLFFGGIIIAATGITSRGTGEFFGIVIACACFILGMVAHAVAEHFDDGEAADDQPSSAVCG